MSAALLACTSPTTQLLVVVDSDLEVPRELATIVVSVEGADSALVLGDDEPLRVPLSFGVVPRDASETQRVDLSVVALDADGRSLVTRRVVTSFVHGRTLLLPVPLARACLAVECGTEETCEGGACVAALIDPATLASADPAAPPPILIERGGPTDGGRPPPIDAPMCRDGEPCSPGPCREGMYSCAMSACVVTARAPAGTDCGEGRTCDETGTCGGPR